MRIRDFNKDIHAWRMYLVGNNRPFIIPCGLQAPGDDLIESPEEIASKFNGTCKRLGAGQAAYVYWKSGGLMLGLVSLFIFTFTQTTRIMGDWWIRWVLFVSGMVIMLSSHHNVVQS
jgi:hypothetical protein